MQDARKAIKTKYNWQNTSTGEQGKASMQTEIVKT